MHKSVWIVLIASMLVGVGGYADSGQSPEKKNHGGGCGCGKPK